MLRVYACIVHEHDIGLVLVAGLICFLASLTSFAILERARAGGERKLTWLLLAGFVAGTGIWSTHFVAMLAYQPQLPIGYDVDRTLLSVAVAILITGSGWFIGIRDPRWTALPAGAVIAAGIATMHYIGMSAMNVSGHLVWDETMVMLSLFVGIFFSTAAVALHKRNPSRLTWRPALLFTVAICGLHFIAMGAASIYPDPRIAVPPEAISSATLAVVVVAMALLIMTISFAVVVLDRQLARNAAEEARRLRTFANAAVEGLVVVDGEQILDANMSFMSLVGMDLAAIGAKRLVELFPALKPETASAGNEPAIETKLIKADGSSCDVEVLLRRLDWQGSELRVLAVRDITDRKEAAARIAHLAFHDALTGLPNRAVFASSLATIVDKAEADAEPIAVLCIDLDGFKAVNDVYGHPAGDELLVAVAQRLRATAGDAGLVARLGGDEFAVIQIGGSQPGHAGALSERLLNALEQMFAIDGQEVRVSASIGVAVFPANARTPAELIKYADLALYRAKAEGRGIVRFYEAAMDQALRDRRQLETDLRQAIASDQLSVHYQPMVDLEQGSVLGFEALLRWHHPRLGEIGPATFIPLAEESGFIVELGAWVLRKACSEAAQWTPALKLSVNLSPVQFRQDDLAQEIEAILVETGLEPSRLDLEITEGLLIKEPDRAIAILQRLKALGVQISMDDFGTGYSSLSYFRTFPFDKVKIDQSFVRDMMINKQARAIVRSVIGLGRGLGMPVVAEGVETQEQLEALRLEGCDQAQGYLISRPNPIAYFERVVIDREVVQMLPARRAAKPRI
ncbi:MAG: diguanylate phosphodiesterase [Alphaproteobacteria bacterium]|nr:diguanylate phosphodiesterase [Alphaproteobacteria bacterium]